MEMNLLFGFVILAFFQVSYGSTKCGDIIIRNIHHEKEVLLANMDSPYQLAIDYNSSTLFFSYSSVNEGFISALIDLKTNEHTTIPGIIRGFANTVDNKNHIVYLGGGDGLYEFEYGTKTAKHIERTNHSIWQMFFKNNVYYSTYPNEKVYIFKDGKSEIVEELANTRAMLVALNNDLDFYFTNSSGLFKLKKSNGETLLLGDYTANAMTADNNGNVYFSMPNGIYFIDKNDEIIEIASIPEVYGVAIESNGNIIYASQNAIVRLKSVESPCYINE